MSDEPPTRGLPYGADTLVIPFTFGRPAPRRNVSTTLIQPGSAFRLGYSGSCGTFGLGGIVSGTLCRRWSNGVTDRRLVAVRWRSDLDEGEAARACMGEAPSLRRHLDLIPARQRTASTPLFWWSIASANRAVSSSSRMECGVVADEWRCAALVTIARMQPGGTLISGIPNSWFSAINSHRPASPGDYLWLAAGLRISSAWTQGARRKPLRRPGGSHCGYRQVTRMRPDSPAGAATFSTVPTPAWSRSELEAACLPLMT